MAAVSVKLGHIGPQWTAACKKAVTDLNHLFLSKGIGVTLVLNGPGPQIAVSTDPNLQGNLVHGLTSATTEGGAFSGAEVKLPLKLTINTPGGVREAGLGMYEVVAAHEFVHALGHEPHTSQLMTQTFQKTMGDHPAGDKLTAGSASLPPLKLSDDSVDLLKSIWT